MFKNENTNNDIMFSMANNLITEKSKLLIAIENINKACNLFNKYGFSEQSQELKYISSSLISEQLFKIASKKDINDIKTIDDVSEILSNFKDELKKNNLSEDDMNDIFKSLPTGMSLDFLERIEKVLNGTSTVKEEFKKFIKEKNIFDPEVKEKIMKRLMTAIKLVEIMKK